MSKKKRGRSSRVSRASKDRPTRPPAKAGHRGRSKPPPSRARTPTDDTAVENERRYRELFENSLCGNFVSRPDGRLIACNRAFARMFGFESVAEALATDVLQLYSGAEARAEFLELLRRERKLEHFEAERRRRDGTPIHIVEHIVGTFDGGGELIEMSGIVIDNTERKQFGERLLQSERLAAIGEAMAGLAHESRNALQRSAAALEMLELRLKDQPEVCELLGEVMRSQDYLHQLYEEVREYAAPLRVELRKCDLGQILQQAWKNLISLENQRTARVEQETNNLDLSCEADPRLMEQVFRNILENSLAACADPVQVRTEWSEAELSGRPLLRVGLRDNGPGFTVEAKARIFEPFFTTKTQGTGLGMPIAKRIVEAHGGQIAVGDTSRSGAEIVVTLPRTGD